MMQNVAVHLRDYARKLSDPQQMDVFGRSAFNRFYYACYWEVRTTFPHIHKNWAKIGHKALPPYLTSSAKQDILKQLDRLHKAKVVGDSEYAKLKGRIEHSLAEISRLLIQGYSIRCVADYNPEIKTEYVGDSLILNGQKISSIEHLYSEIRKYVGILRDCLDEINP